MLRTWCSLQLTEQYKERSILLYSLLLPSPSPSPPPLRWWWWWLLLLLLSSPLRLSPLPPSRWWRRWRRRWFLRSCESSICVFMKNCIRCISSSRTNPILCLSISAACRVFDRSTFSYTSPSRSTARVSAPTSVFPSGGRAAAAGGGRLSELSGEAEAGEMSRLRFLVRSFWGNWGKLGLGLGLATGPMSSSRRWKKGQREGEGLDFSDLYFFFSVSTRFLHWTSVRGGLV
ncbi:putative trihelix transcription factor ASIL1 [Iris pallida]|uniref:Trihelix transcription factor ASIL1 n=1 Tax=Iris pallida TaxID=29817 RepID=A0AAX6EME4_IRIPA|nr:putative trihelix transcription factor ASIL1 [Iris pallida]KAJ6847597.1 putative trihelix transcription factor ASIL1 [Iris pallida]